MVFRHLLLWLTCLFSLQTFAQSPNQANPAEPTSAPKLTKAPSLSKFVQAVYPIKAFQEKIEGFVIMKLTIDQQGQVVDMATDEVSPPNYGFEDAAKEAVKAFSFTPAEIDHQPAMVQIKYRYVFKLNQVNETPKVETANLEKQKKLQEIKAQLSTAEQTELNEPLPEIDGPTGTLEGILLESGSQAPVAGVRVVLEGFDVGRLSNENGRFRFLGVPVGRVSLIVNDQEFDSAMGSFVVRADRKNPVATLYLVRKKFSDEHKIKGEAPKRVATSYRIKQDEITQIAGIDSDSLKSLQDLPSIRRMSFDMAGLVFRGTGPGALYLYNQSVQTPFHLSGIRSAIPTSMIGSIEVMPDFGVAYDRVGSGVVQLNLVEAPKDRLRGKFEYNPFEISAYLGGPLSTKSTLSGSFRQGLFYDHLKLVNPSEYLKYGVNVPRTSDAHLRYTYKTNEHQLELFGSWLGDFGNRNFTTIDQYDPNRRGLLKDQQQSLQLYAQLKSRLKHELYHQGNISYAVIDYQKDFSQVKKQSLQLHHINVQSQIRKIFSKNYTLVGGFEQVSERLSYDLMNVTPMVEGDAWRLDGSLEKGQAQQKRWTLSPSAWTEFEWKLLRLQVVAGLRASYWSDTDQFLAQPRLNIRYQPAFGTMLKLSAGSYMQRLDPRFLDQNVGNPNLQHQQNINLSAGFEQRFSESISMDFTGYYRDIQHRLHRSLDPISRYESDGTGQVAGAEMLIRYDLDHRFYGWASYAFNYVRLKDDFLKAQPQRRSDFDQVHKFSLLGGWKILPSLSLNLRWRYISGSPYTDLNTVLFDSEQGRNIATNGFINEYQFSTFHQLDLRVDYAFAIRYWKVTVYAQLYNLYGHRNDEKAYFDASRPGQLQTVQSMPTWSSIGIRGEF
jgi:TonB family protein